MNLRKFSKYLIFNGCDDQQIAGFSRCLKTSAAAFDMFCNGIIASVGTLHIYFSTFALMCALDANTQPLFGVDAEVVKPAMTCPLNYVPTLFFLALLPVQLLRRRGNYNDFADRPSNCKERVANITTYPLMGVFFVAGLFWWVSYRAIDTQCDHDKSCIDQSSQAYLSSLWSCALGASLSSVFTFVSWATLSSEVEKEMVLNDDEEKGLLSTRKHGPW